MDDWAVRVSSLGIRFFLPARDGGRRKEEFWALREINFEVKRGEVFGIIGSNGSGKSTLLKIIAGIYPATTGKAEVRGNVAPLIELGAAFNPELTGAENIYLAGSIYRVPRKVIKEKFESIVEFSGLRRFIHTPIKNYSSGMFIRLAFSVIIFFEPDVVLIDEIFAVGDRVFQQKSLEKILSFRERGAALLIVSHDMNLIKQLCHRVAVLSRGKLSFLGKPEEAVNYYLDLIKKREGLEEMAGTQSQPLEQVLTSEARRWGSREVEILRVEFVDEAGRPKEVFHTGDYFEARINYVNHRAEGLPVFGVAIYTIYGLLLYGPNTLEKELAVETSEKEDFYHQAISGEIEQAREDSFQSGERIKREIETGEGAGKEGEREVHEARSEKPGSERLRTEEPSGPEVESREEQMEERLKEREAKIPRRGYARFIIDCLPLLEGDYLFSASVYDATLSVAYDHHEMMYLFRVKSPGISDFGAVRLESRWSFTPE